MNDRHSQESIAPAIEPPSLDKKSSPWLIFVLPIGLGLCLSIGISFFKWLQEENTRLLFIGLDGMRVPLVIGLIVCVVMIIALLCIRPRWRTIAIAASLLFLAGYTFSKLVRVESYYGNRTPRLTWRRTPTAEQKVKEYLISTTTAKLLPTNPGHFQPTNRDFPGFLGSDRKGCVNGIDLAAAWDLQTPRLLWRHPVGIGWSSFAVFGNAAINLEQRDDNECVVCYDLLTGTEIWCHAEVARFKNEHGDGPRSTPTIHDGRVVSLGGTGVLTCLDLESGELKWKHALLDSPDKQNLMFGMSISPLVFDDKVLITPGAGPGASAVCYALETGEEVWRSGDEPASYSSPLDVSLNGQRQLLSFNGAGLRSYDLEGNPLWLQPWLTQGESRVNVAQPVIVASNREQSEHGARILISSGYDKGTALLKVSLHEKEWTSEIVWSSKHLKSKLSNFVVFNDHIYGLDNGLLTCIDLKDGERKWKRGRYGHGQILLVGDKLLLQAESGEVVLVAPHPSSLQELGRFPALAGKTWNHPALAGNILVVRNDHEAAAYELPVE